MNYSYNRYISYEEFKNKILQQAHLQKTHTATETPGLFGNTLKWNKFDGNDFNEIKQNEKIAFQTEKTKWLFKFIKNSACIKTKKDF